MVSEREVRATAYELSAGVCSPARADQLIAALAREGELVMLADRKWTTRRVREIEQTTVELAERRAGETAAPVSEDSLRRARSEIAREIKGSLTPEQREALQTITGRGSISVLIGRAGTGKGVVIGAAARAWQLEGNEVIGTAIAGAVAQRLREEARLDRSFTADGLINAVENGRVRLDANTVVIMDEAGMADHERLSRLTALTARSHCKLLAVGDSAQLGAIGPGGLFKALEGRVPAAELSEVHRAHHEWERRAWEQVRTGDVGPALAQYKAHERLHIHVTRAQTAQAMVAEWHRSRSMAASERAVMITDASNRERDQINAMAQECRARAGELGAQQVPLRGKPYGLAAGDEIMFTGQCRIPGEGRVENGITGTILDADREEQRVTIKTRERDSREVSVDTGEFSDISLAYCVHVHKSQGLTAESAGVLMGGWQTDREHAYVALSRARESTHIYVSLEDLGERGMDVGAIERLGERIAHSRAQEATIGKEVAVRDRSVGIGSNVESIELSEPHAANRRIEQQDRERDFERGRDPERDRGAGFGIE